MKASKEVAQKSEKGNKEKAEKSAAYLKKMKAKLKNASNTTQVMKAILTFGTL